MREDDTSWNIERCGSRLYEDESECAELIERGQPASDMVEVPEDEGENVFARIKGKNDREHDTGGNVQVVDKKAGNGFDFDEPWRRRKAGHRELSKEKGSPCSTDDALP